ncbi:acetyltransferase [Agarivorans albus MKT 106]|uniref:Acetyltransferase n=1 Tax=Agarivorans albus MKT 106 TaxID=1331007 RepID=R9PU81_AGAAL|nr:acetyltransferase [Agarivorans albus MKT 106]
MGFVGSHDSKVEMLFILNEARGRGVSKALLQYAIEHLGATKADVNEQKPQAVGFTNIWDLRSFHVRHLMIWANLFQFCA